MAKKLTSTELPNWPRLMAMPIAAAYLGISEGMFRRGVNGALWPRALTINRRKLWDRKLLDAKVDELSNIIVLKAQARAEEKIKQRLEPQPARPPRAKQGHVLR